MKKAQPEWCSRAVARMEERGLKQTDLMETFGVSTRGAVGHYLSGRREPSIGQFQRLAEKLGFASMDELFGGALPETAPLASVNKVEEPVAAYELVRQDHDLIRELLAGVLSPLGLLLTDFGAGENGVHVVADWYEPPTKHRRGLSAMQDPGGGLPGEIKRAARPVARKVLR